MGQCCFSEFLFQEGNSKGGEGRGESSVWVSNGVLVCVFWGGVCVEMGRCRRGKGEILRRKNGRRGRNGGA